MNKAVPAQTSSSVPASAIRQMMAKATQMPNVIRLEIGEPSFATPPHIISASDTAARSGFTHYTPASGLQELRHAIAGKLNAVNGIGATQEQVTITAGGVEALFVALKSITEPGDEVLLPDPGWPNYTIIAHVLNLHAKYYHLTEQNGFQPDPDELHALCSPRVRAIILNTPSNPLGTIISQSSIRQISAVAEHHGLWIVSDECYDQIVFESQYSSVAAVASPEHSICCFSFSKTYAMTGWRVGYVYAPNAITKALAALQVPILGSVSAPTQYAALAALNGPQHYVDDMVATYRARRDMLTHLFASSEIACRPPDGTFFAWVSIARAGMSSMNFTEQLLQEDLVSVAPGFAFGSGGDRWIRLSLATEQDDLVEGVSRIIQFINRKSGLHQVEH